MPAADRGRRLRWEDGAYVFPRDRTRSDDGRTAASALDHRPARTPSRAHPGLVHAPGRSQPARVPRDCAWAPRCSTRAWIPSLASEITLQPVRRHGVDAAVFFSDIVIPLRLAGVPVEIVPGRGPVLDTPIRIGIRHPAPAPDRSRRARADPRGRRPHGRRTREHTAHRIRRCAVHARVLPRRGRTVEGPAARAQSDGLRPERRGRSC